MERSDIQALIDDIQTGVPNTALKVRTVLNAIADGIHQTGDVKEIHVSNAYMAANFDVTGLGINERLGWKICNGNNDTRDKGKRVSIQYHPTEYPILGATGGNKTHQISQAELPNLTLKTNTNIDFGSGDGISRQRAGAASGGVGDSISVSLGGSGTSFSLEQPYIVSLFIVKI